MEDYLVYAKDNNKLVIQNLKNGDEIELSMPEDDLETIDYIAGNPQDEKEIVFHTIGGSIYQTDDRGESWSTLVKNGEIIE